MKYLVLGANSFYGSSFVKLLKEKKEDVECLSKPEFNIDHPVTFRQWRRSLSGVTVVNFISRSAVAESWDDPCGWLQTNVVNTTALIEAMFASNCALFLHVSTPEVYGSNTSWVAEKTPFRPSTPYAVSRAAADMMLNCLWRGRLAPIIITRTANIYGRGQQNHRLIPKAFKIIASGGRFPIHGNGNSVRSFIHVSDAAAALWLLSKRGDFGQTYHISTTKTHKITDVIAKIARILRRDLEDCVERTPDRLGKDHAYLLDSNKIRTLGWSDKITLDQGLKDYANNSIEPQTGQRLPREV